MKIIGTEEELDWVREALANNCEGCIFEEQCNQAAHEEKEANGKIATSCRDFLEKRIEFVLLNEKNERT